MPKFVFEAVDSAGKGVRGEIDAASESEARIKLRVRRLSPRRVSELKVQTAMYGKRSTAIGGSVKIRDLTVFTRQLATLISSGIPLLQALETLGTSARAAGLQNAILTIVSDIQEGQKLGQAMMKHPKTFDRLYQSMIAAGEESGNLEVSLGRLATSIEKSAKLQGKVKGAMIYPAAIIVVAAAVVAALLIFVIPKFTQFFSSSGQKLPALTQLVVDASDFMAAHWWKVLVAMFVAGYMLRQYLMTDVGKASFDAFILRVPILGDLVKKAAIARFSRTLSTLLSSGVNILDALQIASRTAGNSVLEKVFTKTRDSISEGRSLAAPLSKEKVLPSMVVQMIDVGEVTGALDQMLNKVADFYDDEVDIAVDALTRMMEPMLMVVLGSIIAFIVVAMYLPIFNLAGAVGG